MTKEQLLQFKNKIAEDVKQTYALAEKAIEPSPHTVEEHNFSHAVSSKRLKSGRQLKDSTESWSMLEAFNLTLNQILKENNKAVIFGQDVEDPKGGVFGLTRNLSTQFPHQVHNSPLAEATIAGTASGLSMAGYLPIFELQFIDFVGTAFNQIVNQIATLRWRSVGQYKCPLVMYAPCGSYISGGGPWHSQTNEAWFAHAPGLKVCMPSNANDAANMLYNAAYGDDPVLMLLPKNQFQKTVKIEDAMPLYPEAARVVQTGEHVTFVSWGNGVEVAAAAAQKCQNIGVSVELLDLRSIVPCDWVAIHRSVRKTGRLVVVQEDNKTCSFGQAIISEITSDKETWESLYSPPQLVSRGDIHIGFNARLERAVLPHAESVLSAAKQTLGAV